MGTKKKDAEHVQAWKSVMVESIIFSLDENAVSSCGVVRGGNGCFNLTLGTPGHPAYKKNQSLFPLLMVKITFTAHKLTSL